MLGNCTYRRRTNGRSAYSAFQISPSWAETRFRGCLKSRSKAHFSVSQVNSKIHSTERATWAKHIQQPRLNLTPQRLDSRTEAEWSCPREVRAVEVSTPFSMFCGRRHYARYWRLSRLAILVQANLFPQLAADGTQLMLYERPRGAELSQTATSKSIRSHPRQSKHRAQRALLRRWIWCWKNGSAAVNAFTVDTLGLVCCVLVTAASAGEC